MTNHPRWITDRHLPRDRSVSSRILHRVDRVTASATAAVVVCLLAPISVVALIVAGFPDVWTEIFWTVCGSTSVIMAFVIQHTQSRLQLATQLKLDELVRSAPQADDRLVHIESGGDSELAKHEQRLIEHRERATAS